MTITYYSTISSRVIFSRRLKLSDYRRLYKQIIEASVHGISTKPLTDTINIKVSIEELA